MEGREVKFEVPFEGEEREEREDGRRKRLSFPAMMWRIKTGGGGGSSWMSSGGGGRPRSAQNVLRCCREDCLIPLCRRRRGNR